MTYYKDEISNVEITWKDGYKRITVQLENGEEYTVEQDD